MINYDRDEQIYSQTAEAIFDSRLSGFTDGSQGHEIDLRFLHDNHYMKCYVIGFTQWVESVHTWKNYDTLSQEF